MNARKFRKKPRVVEAMQWDGTVENATEIIDWVLAHGGTASYHDGNSDPATGELTDSIPHIAVKTLDSTARVFRWDWMMRGTVGEFYPCVPDVFLDAYEPVEDAQVPEMTDESVARLMTDVTGL